MKAEDAIRSAMERTANAFDLGEPDHLADLADAVLDQLEAVEGVDKARARTLAHHLCRRARVESRTTVAGVRAGLRAL